MKQINSNPNVFSKFWITALFLALSFFYVQSSFAAYSGSGAFAKVENLSDLEDGAYYVLYGVNSSYKGALSNAISGGRFTVTSVSISSDEIIDPATSIVWRLNANGSNWNLYNEASSKYCEITASSTSGFSANSSASSSYSVSVSSGNFKFMDASISRGISIYQSDFRPYASSSMKTLYLYKLESVSACTSSDIAFSGGDVSKEPGDAKFTQTASYSGSKTITYSSSNTSVATVNSSTGEVTIVAAGTSTITAQHDADGTYCAGSATYILTVACPTLSAPVATTASTVGANSFTANWNAVTGADHYEVDVYTNSGSGTVISEDFISFSDWTDSGTASDTDSGHYGDASPCRALGSGDYIISPACNNPTELKFNQDASSGGNGNTAYVYYMSDQQASWTSLYSFTVSTAGGTETVDLSSISSNTNVRFKFSSSFNTWYLDDVEVVAGSVSYVLQNQSVSSASYSVSGLTSGVTYNYVVIAISSCDASETSNSNEISVITAVSTDPTLVVSPSSITGLDYLINAGPSSAQTFTVSGSYLSSENITVTAPTNFEISLNGSSYGSNLTISNSGGTLSATTIYVRLKSGLSVASYAGNVSVSGGGASTVSIAMSGAVSESIGSGGCPIIEGAMINSCGTNEGPNEFVVFTTTSAEYVSSYTVYYDNDASPTSSPIAKMSGADATTKTGSGSVTSSCSFTYVTDPTTIIPANSRVLFIPSDLDQDYVLDALCNGGNVYVVFIDRSGSNTVWTLAGNFANSSGDRYIQLTNGSSTCSSNMVTYNSTHFNSTSADGNFVSWDYTGATTYSNDGCSAIPSTCVTPIISGLSSVAEGSSISLTADQASGTWSSANSSIASVNASGVVTGISEGVVEISYTVGACVGEYTITVTGASACNKVIAEWLFDGKSSSDFSTTLGSGVISAIGGVTKEVTDSDKGGQTAGTTNSDETTAVAEDDKGQGLQTDDYPSSTTAAEYTYGLKIAVPTTGYSNIYLQFDMRYSNKSANAMALQYTTDGSTWTTANTYKVAHSSKLSGTDDYDERWYMRKYNFSGVAAAENNANFAVRIVAIHDGTKFVAATTSKSYDGGKWRFDNIIVTGDVLAPTLTVTNPDASCTEVNLTAATVTAGSDNGLNFTYWEDASATSSLSDPDAVSASGTYYIKGAIANLTSSLGWALGTTSSSESCTATKAVSVTVNTPPTITGVTGANRCHAGSLTLEATASAGVVNWYADSTTTTLLATGTSYSTEDISGGLKSYFVEALANGCKSAERYRVSARVYSKTTTWIGAANTVWQNDDNWSDGVPSSCTNVIISTDGVDANYPVILTTGECNDITFEPETGVKGIENLNYSRAFVQMKVARDKWYTIKSPLKNMYSGDYYFSGSPVTYMRLFDDVNPDLRSTTTVKSEGTWTSSFVDLSVSLDTITGFAFELTSTQWHYPTGCSVVYTDTILTFPRINPDSSLVRLLPKYSGITGKQYPEIATEIEKDSSKAYRFLAEDESGNIRKVKIPIKQGLNLIGNPLMTHLNFSQLHTNNSDKINNVVKIWNGVTFVSYMCLDDFTASSSMIGLTDITSIPPMQAFFVYSEAADTLVIDPSSDFTTNNTTKLRSSKTPYRQLYVQAENGESSSGTLLMQNDAASNTFGDDDAFKLFSQYAGIPEVYTMAGSQSLDINQFATYPYSVPLCLHTNEADSVTLNFIGAESFDDVDVYLVNSLSGENVNLKETTSYSLDVDASNAEGTLFIEFRNAEVTSGVSEAASSDINIYSKNEGRITVISSPSDKIKSVSVYDVIGRQVASLQNVDASSVLIPVDKSTAVYIVKVVTENSFKETKLMVK